MTRLSFHPLRVASVQPDTDEAVILRLELPDDASDELRDAFAYSQGQYLTLRREIDGEELRRSYSICAGVDDATLRVGVRRVAGGRFSNWVQRELKAGDVIDVMPPQGRFFVPVEPASARHYLGLAGGSGITPILSIMKTVLAREPASRFTLIYGNRRQASTMFKEELEDLKNRYMTRLTLHHVFSDEVTDVPLQAGLMNRAKIGEFLGGERWAAPSSPHPLGGPDDLSAGMGAQCPLVDPAGIDHAFVCGPYQMNDEAEAALSDAGVPAERIHIERFGAPLPNAGDALKHHAEPGDAPQATLVVMRDGLQREVPYRNGDASILDAIAAAGLEAPYSCKSGVCATCRCRVLEGRVRMDRNFSLDAADLAAGFVLTCQAHPLTERVLLSYDDR